MRYPAEETAENLGKRTPSRRTPAPARCRASGVGFPAARSYVHAGMHVGQAAAVRVHRRLAAKRRVSLRDERRGFAASQEAQIFERTDGQVRERMEVARTEDESS